jgi:NAD(P)H-dependent FMN reductase
MKIGIIAGSHRSPSQSERVAELLVERLSRIESVKQAWTFSLADNTLPLWNESFWRDESAWDPMWKTLSDQLREMDGLILVAPEWAGMCPPALKNFLLLASKKELNHKPCLIVGISSGTGGAYPVSELRMSGSKNNGLVFLPDHLILRQVESLKFSDDEKFNESSLIQNRIDGTLEILVRYAQSLRNLRKDDAIQKYFYRYGM